MGVARRVQWMKVLALTLPLALAGCGGDGEDLTGCKILKKGVGADTEEQGQKLSKKLFADMKEKAIRRSKYELSVRDPQIMCKKQKASSGTDEAEDDSPYKLKEQKKKKKKTTAKEPLMWCTVKLIACPVEKEKPLEDIE